MPSSSGSIAPSGESPLDARLCAEIGAELARARQERTLSVAQVGDRLLLSIRQVKALEEVDLAAFHNPTYFVNAMRKYATFAGLDPAIVTPLASAVARPALSTSPESSDAGQAGDGSSRRGLLVALAVVAMGGAVAAGGYMLRGRGTQTSVSAPGTNPAAITPRAPQSPREPEPPPQIERAPVVEPAVAVAAAIDDPASPLSTAFGSVRVVRPTWIFVRDADSNVTERWLAAGEAFELESQPTYLAVGSPDVELMIGSQRLDLSRFVASGQIRIRAGDFDALVQGASPIPAPTAAVVR